MTFPGGCEAHTVLTETWINAPSTACVLAPVLSGYTLQLHLIHHGFAGHREALQRIVERQGGRKLRRVMSGAMNAEESHRADVVGVR